MRLDPGTLGAFLSLLVLVIVALIGVTTWRRTWMTQTITELRSLADAQEKKIDFLEEQLKLMTEQSVVIHRRLREMEADSLSLVRRNRELEERDRHP